MQPEKAPKEKERCAFFGDCAETRAMIEEYVGIVRREQKRVRELKRVRDELKNERRARERMEMDMSMEMEMLMFRDEGMKIGMEMERERERERRARDEWIMMGMRMEKEMVMFGVGEEDGIKMGVERCARESKPTPALKRAKDGSAFTLCEAWKRDVAVALIDMHSCSLDSQIMTDLESQVVEKVSEPKKPAKESLMKKKTEGVGGKTKKEKKEKKMEDPTKPKRPTTAYFLFMDDFRKGYKEAHPDSKSVGEVAKKGGFKWKSLTEEEKKLYLDKAAELKAEFDKAKGSSNGDRDVDGEEENANKEENDQNDEEISDKDE